MGHLIEDPQEFLRPIDYLCHYFYTMKRKQFYLQKRRRREIGFVGGHPFKIGLVKIILIKCICIL